MINERILIYGGTGSGKSYSWLSLAKKLSDNMFYCIDTDRSIQRMLTTEYKELSNVKVANCRDWLACETALKNIQPIIKPDDWLVIDMVDVLWDFVQSYYVQQIFHKDIDDYFMQMRQGFKGGSKLETLKGWTDWVVINKLYQDFINTVMYELECNIFATAKASKLNDTDDSSINDTFSIVGYKPEGEKRNAYRVHTVLYTNHNSSGYFLTTIKDRGRQILHYTEVKNFADTYIKVIEGQEVISTTAVESRAKDTLDRYIKDKGILVSKVCAELGIGKMSDITDYKAAYEKLKTIHG